MSQEEVQQVISLVANHDDFRKLLSTNPQKALKNYDLTKEERNALKDIASSRFKFNVDGDGHLSLRL